MNRERFKKVKKKFNKLENMRSSRYDMRSGSSVCKIARKVKYTFLTRLFHCQADWERSWNVFHVFQTNFRSIKFPIKNRCERKCNFAVRWSEMMVSLQIAFTQQMKWVSRPAMSLHHHHHSQQWICMWLEELLSRATATNGTGGEGKVGAIQFHFHIIFSALPECWTWIDLSP